MKYFQILVAIISVSSEYSRGEPYVPKALRTRYDNFSPEDQNYGNDYQPSNPSREGVKSAGVKTAGVKTAGVKTYGVKNAAVKSTGVKTAPIKNAFNEQIDSQKTFQKMDLEEIIYKGGCTEMPPAPINSKIRCSQYSGCRANCVPSHQFPNGQNQLFITCNYGRWRVEGTDWEDIIPSCQPICSPPCLNNGICISPNVCDCPENYSGTRCEFESKPCLNYPPISLNAKRVCTSTTCTITCMDGHEFPDGSTIANMICKGGSWVPSKLQWVTVPDCKATCTPPCKNGGDCLAFNVCQCLENFRGPRCEYSANACSARKLEFNGGYNCSGIEDSFSCSLSCPEGIEFEFPPAQVYTCLYEEGRFLPEPIPKCVFGENVEVVSSRNHAFSFVLEGAQSETGFRDVILGGGIKNGRHRLSNVQFPSSGAFDSSNERSKVVIHRTPKPGNCFTWGGSHYKTFDGKTFSFTSECAHTLIKDVVDDTFTVITENSKHCQNKSTDCHKIIKIYLQNKEYTLARSDAGKLILTSGKKVLTIPGRAPGIRVQMGPRSVIVVIDSIGVTIKWDGTFFVQVEVKESLWNRTAGLCGLLDGNQENDMLLKDGTKPKTSISLAADWQAIALEGTCKAPITEEHACQNKNIEAKKVEKASKFCRKLLNDKRFHACRTIIDPHTLMDACRWDYCTCKEPDPTECSCETINVYVLECRAKGITNLTNWRDEHTCPLKCTGGRMYMECAPDGGQSTCNGITDISEEKTSCEEGCYCPEGTVLHESECIPISNCPCAYRGQQLPPGSHVPKRCNTCTCVQGKWKCTQVSCGARCSALGDPHYITFDGKRYDFMGQCTYYLVRHDNFTITGENIACTGAISESMDLQSDIIAELPSCTRALEIQYDGHIIKLKQNHEIVINNRDITRLPFEISGITVRFVSSIFIIVELTNGVTVWWDGLTRVYIDVTASFFGQTKGLCGTFNENQNDDFKTPEGDVEQSTIPFANKWKSIEKCNDVPDRIKSHPCVVNIQNKLIAEEHCKLIRSSMFSACHLYVDPEAFYQDCLYDLCSCEGDITKCLCPMISAYAAECAENGIKIDWRNDVKECEIQCPAGQKYQICGNTCTRTCYHIATKNDCVRQCAEGCNCPEGEALNERGECVPIGQCDCQQDGLSFPSGYKETRPSSKIPQLCTCMNAQWNCRPASPEEMTKYPAAADIKSLCVASKNEEFTTCEPVDQPTCKNMHSIEPVSVAECRPGCKCKEGYVLDTIGKVCIKPNDCPCHHGGRSYYEGGVVKNECNNCTCVHGQWQCTEIPCPAECSAWGDSHYKTFDGKHYDYQGQCDYVLAKGLIKSEHAFDVSVQNVPCGSLGVSCSKAITILIGITPHQESVTLSREAPLPDTSKLKRLVVREVGNYMIVEEPDMEFILHWDKGTRVYLKLGTMWKNRISGLCGNYNDNQMDDFQTPAGSIPEISPKIFGDSWKLRSYCPETVEIETTCDKRPDRQVWALKKCGILKSSVFSSCHSEVPIDDYFERCIFDTCACDLGGDCECLCTALAAYAHECNNKGIAIKWRTRSLCPMQCDDDCSRYDPCISTCPIETCDNSFAYEQTTKTCKYDVCVEGCQIKSCAPGFIYKNSSYSECVPRSECKPVCLEIDDEVYYEGDLMENEDCYSCYCSRGKKHCQGQPCTTTLMPQTEKVQCKPGWTRWINQDKLKIKENIKTTSKGGTKGSTKDRTKSGLKTSKLNDIEPLPGPLTMNSLLGPHCEIENMTDIECRTVIGHITPKETGLNVECSLEHGLICTSTNEADPCPDFEIRLKCDCGVCDPFDTSNLLLQHPTNCQLFYQCTEGIHGPEFVENSCGPGTMFNPAKKVCDFPYVVADIRPECGIVTTQILPVEPEFALCSPNEKYVDCAVECTNLCDYYAHTLKLQGRCQNGIRCEEGCVSFSKPTNCPTDHFWANNDTCVIKHDCMCVSYEGKPVKPGEYVQESSCEVCQCVDNFYMCDNSICATPKQETPTRQPSMPRLFHFTTVSPPLECDENRFINLINNPENPLNNEAFSASSYLNKPFAPYHARILDKPTKSDLGRSWSPKIMNQNQYLQIDFGRQEPVYGVIVQGNPIYEEYVTSYYVLFSSNGHSFDYITDLNKQPKIFRGPIDNHQPVKQMFEIPVEAKSIRINPLTWQGRISLKVELLGCGEVTLATTTTATPVICSDPMGISNSLISDDQITVSSESSHHTKGMIRFASKHGWQPFISSTSEWVQIDFLEPRNLTGLITNGGPDGWVTAFHVKYSHNNKDWNAILGNLNENKVFLGNFDSHTSQINTFDIPVQARYIQIVPIKWHNIIQLRLEVIGCFVPYPIKTTTTTEPILVACESCRGIPTAELELGGCPCRKGTLWNGKECVIRAECPCTVEHISYPIGTVFEKEDCTKCVCKLGGIEHCTPIVCSPCEKGLRSVINAACKCTCRPCPDRTVLCPTSNICINATDWCNGVKDCPDDEVGCEPPVLSAKIPHRYASAVKLPQCQSPLCPEGYQIVIDDQTKSEKIRTTMFSYGTSSTKGGGSKGSFERENYGVKGGTKGRTRKMPSKTSQSTSKRVSKEYEDVCPTFACTANIKAPVRVNAIGAVEMKCPPAVCPTGYNPEFENKKMSVKTSFCPKYFCKLKPPLDAICEITGRTFVTFDHTEFKYDICNHVVARDFENYDWDIILKKECNKICSRNLIINHEEHIFIFFPDLTIEFDDYKYTLEQTKKIGRHYQFFDIMRLGDALVFISFRFNFWVIWDIEANVKIGVSKTLIETIDGMCGYFNDYSKDDKRTPEGVLAKTTDEFGDSWMEDERLPLCDIKACPKELETKAWEICSLVKDETFAPCASSVDAENFIPKCMERTCICLESTNTSSEDKDQQCKCRALQKFVGDCLSDGTDDKLIDWRMKYDCPALCPAPLIHNDCYRRRCEPTCGTLNDPQGCPKLENVCFPGCYCPAGYVRSGEKCVPPQECGDCECSLLPDLRYISYDERNFTINGKCSYVMSRDIKSSKGENHDFEVIISNTACEDKKSSSNKMCIGKIAVTYKGRKMIIRRDVPHNKLKILINNEGLTDYSLVKDWAQIKMTSQKHAKINLHLIQVQISVFHPSLGVNIKVPSYKFGGNLEGICADCNGDSSNDMQTPNHEIIQDIDDFANAWLSDQGSGVKGVKGKQNCGNMLKEECVNAPKPDPCEQLEDHEKFGQCHPLLNPKLYVEWCRKETCNGDAKNACEAIEAYARECAYLGVCTDWHSPACPTLECPHGMTFKVCARECQQTCDSIKEKESDECAEVSLEGCFCPKGKVLFEDECVIPERCEPCDNEGHWIGDTWMKDVCTNCTCDGHRVKCDVKTCSNVVTICEKGFMVMNVSEPDQCCDKFICVPKPTETTTCASPQPIHCGFDQKMNLITNSDGCSQFVCECKPIEECDKIVPTLEPLQPGIVREIDHSGCCPILHEKCLEELCLKPPEDCEEFFVAQKEIVPEECCPKYVCVPPKHKCIVTLEYGENVKAIKKNKYLKEADEVWMDGPCRECKCLVTPAAVESVCTEIKCQLLTDSADYQDYVLKASPITGQCCPEIKRDACKFDGQVYKIGEKWHRGQDYCTTFECVNQNSEIKKITSVTTCDAECEIGWKYVSAPLELKKCCGVCKPYACVVNGILYEIGKKWSSHDYCINYVCVEKEGTVQIQSSVVNCPSVSDDLVENFVIDSKSIHGECCKNYTTVACKVNGVKHEVGQTWPSPDGDKCKTFSCVRNDRGEIIKEDHIQTCNKECNKGWDYRESQTNCCGECVQTACVFEEKIKKPGQKWSSSDYCTNYVCAIVGETKQVQSTVVNCPVLADDVEENFVIDSSPVHGECCRKETIVACKVNGVKYAVGDTWDSPHKDKCKTYKCVKNKLGEIKKEEKVQTCDKQCSKGWEYEESKTECCGKCVQVACVFEEHLKNPGEKWSSSDYCTNYICNDIRGIKQVESSVVNCQVPPIDILENYIVKEIPILGECCKNYTAVACKVGKRTYKVGDKWPSLDGDKCKIDYCHKNEFGEIKKSQHVEKCNKECLPGWEYKESENKCCGECVQVACVIESRLKNPGEKWSSHDYCTKYECVNIEGSLQVQSTVVTCPSLTADLLDNFVIEKTVVPGECCKTHAVIACKVNGVPHKVGDSWPSPGGDKCKNYTCIETELGEIKKEERVETCKTDCPKGWEYKESESSCCGECEQVACVLDDQLKYPHENWTSVDGCTTFYCDKVNNQFMISSMQEMCPDVEDCPSEHIYLKGCCEYCSHSRSQANCIVQEMPYRKTKGLVIENHKSHGKCVNKNIIKGMNECVGSCNSYTMYNAKLGEHESQCACCQATQYTSTTVDLLCEDNFLYKKTIRVPTHCGCQGCVTEGNSKTKSKYVKTG